MSDKLEMKEIVGYLPYGLEAITIVDVRENFLHLEIDNYYIFDKGNIWSYCGYADSDLCIPLGEGEFNGFILRYGSSYADIQDYVKPLLLPLSDLKKDEYYDLYVDLCEEMESSSFEYLLEALINKTSYSFDLKKLEKLEDWMYKNHIDWKYDLIERGLAIDKSLIK